MEKKGDLKVIFTLLFSALIIFMIVMIAAVFSDLFLPRKSEQQVQIISKAFETATDHIFEISDNRIMVLGNLQDSKCTEIKKYPYMCDEDKYCVCIVSDNDQRSDCYDIQKNYDFTFTQESGAWFWKSESETPCIAVKKKGFYKVEFTEGEITGSYNVAISKIS